ncbi:glutamate--putrescine ligase [Colwellia chukchiensis]|uniref:Glutamate--putrescine ligase n=1 Tax=Colwellia chukchiensis TaxID=641665 RepID=A0A1H7QAK9_9GAMM|nr:glutamine synthetase family protein [Colwellia chukchiensis]SEL45003.1 glutamate--putrescine ligase [Colwellia chukchiensis]
MIKVGQLTEVERFLERHPEVEAIDVLISDLVGFARGKRIERSSLKKVYKNGLNMPATIFSMNVLGETIEECGLGQEIGEPDMLCKPIANTIHMASWHKRPIAQLLMSMFTHDNQPFYADPRNALARIVDQLAQKNLFPVVAVELEFYLLDKNRDRAGNLQPPISPKTNKREEHTQVYSVDTIDDYSKLLDEINRVCIEQNVPADTAVAECAPGQFEINLKHQADPLVACDNAILLKRIIKAVADQHDFDASFMAKPYSTEAGSGMHIHVSVLDEQGNNVFADEVEEYSECLEHAIGGLLALMSASMPLLCPNVNSYRRFMPGYYVAMAKNWGVDNRTVALRIPQGPKDATRIEHRVAGADANPYLVMAVILASILHGIENKLTPRRISTGNAFEDDCEALPLKLDTALAALRKDDTLTPYFGEEFINNYLIAKEKELEQFDMHISDLEVKWYLKNS